MKGFEDNGDSTAIVNVTGSGPNPEPVDVPLVLDEPIYLEPAQPNDGDVD